MMDVVFAGVCRNNMRFAPLALDVSARDGSGVADAVCPVHMPVFELVPLSWRMAFRQQRTQS